MIIIQRLLFQLYDWSCERTRLVRQPKFDPMLLKKSGLDRMVLIYDADKTGWSEDERGFGGVDFLSKNDALSFADGEPLPVDILVQCRDIDRPVKRVVCEHYALAALLRIQCGLRHRA